CSFFFVMPVFFFCFLRVFFLFSARTPPVLFLHGIVDAAENATRGVKGTAMVADAENLNRGRDLQR
ncbi:hypothetical protein, partial [Amycolatopsis sp. NPDC059021]|uniref:hypothetical protein n=1 Tax=Amycolatopsis sp. NPDC059021 TaxID=3346704 RepID=UPI00366E4B87